METIKKQTKTRQKCWIHSAQQLTVCPSVPPVLLIKECWLTRCLAGPIEFTSVSTWPVRLLASLTILPPSIRAHPTTNKQTRQTQVQQLEAVRSEQPLTFGLLCNRGSSCCSRCLTVSAITLASRLLMCSPLCSRFQTHTHIYRFAIVSTTKSIHDWLFHIKSDNSTLKCPKLQWLVFICLCVASIRFLEGTCSSTRSLLR